MVLRHRHEIVGALVAFIAWGYAVHWLPSLRYILYAFLAGAAASLFVITAILLCTSRGLDLVEDGADSAYGRPRNAAFVASEIWKKEIAGLRTSAERTRQAVYPQSVAISAGVDGIIDLIYQNYVTSWYRNIGQGAAFTTELDRVIKTALVNVRDRLSLVNLVDVMVSRLLPIITQHLQDFDQAEKAVRGRKLNRNVTESDELDLAIASRYREGKLHPAVSLSFSDPKMSQQSYLRKSVAPLLPRILPEDAVGSRAVSVVLNEIVACGVLYPVMRMVSDPDTWNQLMEAYVLFLALESNCRGINISQGRRMLQDRKSVQRLRAALDEHATPTPKLSATQPFPRLARTDNERRFERLIRAVRHCNNLSDARRFRSEVASQLKRELTVEGQSDTYLRRLETAKRLLDRRIEQLSSVGANPKGAIPGREHAAGRGSEVPKEPTLVQILHDASGLSYFMEHMDRHKMISLVQFWIVVDGFRNPLEDDVAEDEDTVSASPDWTQTDRLDIAQINETYLSKPELGVSDVSRDTVRTFLYAGRKATPSQYQRARSAILRAQTAVLEEMQKRYFPGFKRSDLYYKYLAVDRSSNVASTDATRVKGTSDVGGPLRRVPAPSCKSHNNQKSANLRRAAASSADLKSSDQGSGHATPERHSLDMSPFEPLFPDERYDTDPLASSNHSFGIDSESLKGDRAKERMVEAMEAALNDIMDNEPQADDTRNPLFEERQTKEGTADERASFVNVRAPPRAQSPAGEKEPGKPNLASLGLVNVSSRFGVFSDDNIFGDEERYPEDEHSDSENERDERDPADEVVPAAPGDLGLAEAIVGLSSDIERLQIQESIVDTLTRKAELTNDTAELRILGKSKSSLQREIRRKELQRQQYIVQESDNGLYRRATAEIKSVMVGREQDGQEFALYIVEVRRKAGEQMPAATWAVARRYSEFHDLHQRLRLAYPAVRHLDFPRRRLVLKLQKDFLEKRRSALEKYLKELLRMPDVCRSRDLRAFLSEQTIVSADSGAGRNGNGGRDMVTRIYDSVTDGVDDFIGNLPVLEQLSAAGQNLVSAATGQLGTTGATVPTPVDRLAISAAEAEAELDAFERIGRDGVEAGAAAAAAVEPFVKPICDLFLELFDLKRGNNWSLRGRAVVVVLQQLLGGTVERKTREYARALFREDSVVRGLDALREALFPEDPPSADNDKPATTTTTTTRTAAERARSRREASVVLATLVPDLAASVVGRTNAQAAARRLFAALNNGRVTGHLAYTLLDEVVRLLFPGDEGRGR